MTFRVVLLVGLLAGWAVFPVRAGAPAREGGGKPAALAEPEAHPEFLLVGYRKGTAVSARQASHAAAGAEVVRSFKHVPVDVVRVAKKARRSAAERAYRARPEVRYVEPNYRLHKQTIPNDPRFGDLWGLRNTGQAGGTAGADIAVTNVWATMGTGSTNVIVAIIDTGIDYTHPDLVGNVWSNAGELAGNGLDDDGNGIVDDVHGARWTGGSGAPTSGNPMDGDGHGTHVAGTIGGFGNNAVGVAGVNWRVRLMALKFLDDSGSGYTADAVSAIDYAIDKGAHLSNNSWGGGGYSQALKDAIDAAGAANQLFIAAAGNSGTDNDSIPSYPAGYDSANIVAVASSDRNDQRSSFSSYGRTTVDLAAPGSDIWSSTPGNNYESYSGTSMATPHVAGAAALLLSLYPGTSWETLKGWLLDGAKRLGPWTGWTLTGGRLQVSESARIAGLPAGADPVWSFTAASAAGSNTVSLAWLAPAGPSFNHVIIRRGTNVFPASWTEGTLVYSGVVEQAEDGPLALGDRAFYTAWAAHESGTNLVYSAPAHASTRVGGEPDDFFTEQFTASDNDLAHRTLTLVPEASLNRYAAYMDAATSFPTDPAGGTALSLGDDSFATVSLGGGATVPFFGAGYGAFHVGANGYITFDSGDTGYIESLAAHFGRLRVSALFTDLNPSAGGTVSWRQLADRAVVTYENVVEYGASSENSFQVELFFNGVIRITWLALSVTDGLAGIADGQGIPSNFVESDLTAYPPFDDLRIAPALGYAASGVEGGPFLPTNFVYAITNAGSVSLDWTASGATSWISVAAGGGTLAPGATDAVSVSIDADADTLPYGLYDSLVRFSNSVSGQVQSRPVTLAIARPGVTALYRAEGVVGAQPVLTALQRLGYAVTVAASWTEFNGLLASNTYLLAVALNHASATNGVDLTAVSNHLAAGRRALVVDASKSAPVGALLHAVYEGVDNQNPVYITDPELSFGVTNPLPLQNAGYTRWSWGATPTGSAESLADFPAGASAVVWGNGGRSALVNFTADAVSGDSGARFFENLLQLVENGGDALAVSPSGLWSASGYEGGPFAPSNRVFTLENVGAAPLAWTAGGPSNWVSFSASGGLLDAGGATTVTATLNAQADALSPGLYLQTLVISNSASGKRVNRSVALNVLAIPGEIDVSDSIAPTNDRAVLFGERIVGQSVTATVTIHNVDSQYGLTVNSIVLLSAAVSNLGSSATAEAAPPPPARERAPHHPRVLLVGFEPGFDATARDAVHARAGAQRVRSFSRIAVDVVRFDKDGALGAALAAYQAEPGVRFAELNYTVQTRALPNDPRFAELWGLRNTGQTGGTAGADVRAVTAWDYATGSTNVVVGIIDTGIDYTHPDLSGNLWVNPGEIAGNSIDDDANGIVDDVYGARWTDGTGVPTSGDPMDGNQHGTHCAGTIGAVGDNGAGVAGVNWRVRMMALKFLSDAGSGYIADAIAALEYAIARGADLTSNSWGGGGFSQAMKDMIDAAAGANQLFVVAAGNSASDNDVIPQYPANYESANVIAVASSDHHDERSSFSCFGRTTVDLAAPGSSILSTVPGGEYALLSGTSMATPHVAGAAALLLSLNPGAPFAELKRALMQGADVLPAWSDLTVAGGRLNLMGAIEKLNPNFRLAGMPALPAVIPPGGSVSFTVTYQPVEAGVHSGHVRIISNDAASPTVDVAVAGSAVNDALEISPASSFLAEGPPGGPFTPTQQVYVLTNTGVSALSWNASATGSWYAISPASGTLDAGAATTVVLTIESAANALTNGFYVSSLVFSNASSGVTKSRAIQLRVEPRLCEAVDACGFTWTSGGSARWLSQTNVTHDGQDAAQSADIGEGQLSWIETTITGPGELSFWWKVSSEAGWDFLRVSVNGSEVENITGEVDWQFRTLELGAGSNTVRWSYTKDEIISEGADLAWLDQVAFIGDSFVVTPSEPSVFEGPPGGPFEPAGYTLWLINPGTGEVAWTATAGTNWFSVAPGSGVVPAGGTNSVTIALAAPANAMPNGTHLAPLLVSNAASGLVRTRWVQLAVSPLICDALDACALTWTRGGTAEWFGQSSVTHDGVDAGQSGEMGDGAESWIETSVTGPGLLTFWWKVSSEGGWDYLQFHLDGVLRDERSGEVDWEPMSVEIGPGEHTLRWRYAKDAFVAEGVDAGWLDEVRYLRFVYGPADDHAGNYGSPGSNFVNGANEGTGFRPWEIALGAGASAVLGSSTDSSGNINSANGQSFRFYGGNGTYVDAIRPFVSPLRSGDVFRATLAYNWNGGARGLSLLAENGVELCNVNFGGSDVLSFKWGNGSTINLSSNYSATAVLQVAATALGGNQMRVELLRNDGFTTNFTSSGLAAPAARVKFYNGGHPANNLNYALHANGLQIQRSNAYDVDGDGLPDWWEVKHFGTPTNGYPSDAAAGPFTVGEAWVADLDPANPSSELPGFDAAQTVTNGMRIVIDPTSTARVYRVLGHTNLLAPPPDWSVQGPEQTGTGAALIFTVTNDAPARTFRTGIRIP
jgi:subtilisin family serine protease